jgi:DNA modification methylase
MQRTKINGKALLFQADCLAVIPKIKKADFIFTDPPYGHNNNDGDLISNWEKALGSATDTSENVRPILNDDFVSANKVTRSMVKAVAQLLPKGAAMCVCCGGGGGPDPQFARWALMLDKLVGFKQAVTWDKEPMGMGWHYRRSYEFVLVAQKPGAKARWFNTTKKIENIIRPGDYGIKKIIPSATQHPTEKPWQLAAHFISLHTEPGDIVLDPFMGSGSTGVAAVLTGRKFIGIELDPHWYEHATKRIQKAAKDGRDFTPRCKKRARTTIELTQRGLWTTK